MPNIQLKDLPPPPPGKIGWPWTIEASAPAARMPDGRVWPRISVVTPSYNQGRFLEATLRSVLLQDYPNLEYLVLDGGSTDESVQIINKYKAFLDYSVSQRDGGPEFAINDGWKRSTGEFVAFLPSDDFYEPGALAASAQVLSEHPEASFAFGACKIINEADNVVGHEDPDGPFRMDRLLREYYFMAPAVLIRKSFMAQSGMMDTALKFISDWDLWLRLALCTTPVSHGHCVASARAWFGSKTTTDRSDSKTSLIPFERAQVLRGLIQKFPLEFRDRVRSAISFHYAGWIAELTRRQQWRLLPGAYVSTVLWDPAFGLRILSQDAKQTAGRAIRRTLRKLKLSST